MKISLLPFLAGALPLLGVTLAWVWSLTGGHVPDCNPFLHGCTTVSATGRNGIGFFLFKAFVLPAAALFGLFWYVAAGYLQLHGASRRLAITVTSAGAVSAMMLTLYASYLGSDGVDFARYRRLGASSFLATSFLCQLLFVIGLRQGPDRKSRPLACMRLLVLFMLLCGLISLPITIWAEPEAKNAGENIIEWWFGLALLMFYPACAWLWHGQTLDWQRSNRNKTAAATAHPRDSAAPSDLR